MNHRYIHGIGWMLIALFAGLSIGCKKQETAAPATKQEAAAPATMTPKYSLTAEALQLECNKDPGAAKAKYNEACVELTGVVTGFKNQSSGPIVIVAGPPPAGASAFSMYGGVYCESEEAEPWAALSKSQPVKAVGIVKVVNNGATLTKTRITLDGPSVQINVTADGLTAEFAKNPPDAFKKYNEGGNSKMVVISGPLLEKHVGAGQQNTLTLGTANAKVLCECNSETPEAAQALEAMQIGQNVKLAGFFAGGFSAKLRECNLITK
jgi:hypothetical protein